MLEGLADIPWDRMGHAYRYAADVPDILRSLASAQSSSEAEASISELFGNIVHQGTVYEATAHAVPFLIDILKSCPPDVQSDIVPLLACIAMGSSYIDVHQHLVPGGLGDEQELALELSWVQEARGAVDQGFEVFVALAAGEGDTAYSAAQLLAQFPEHVDIVGPLLRNKLAGELDDIQRAGLLLLLGRLGDRSREALDVFEAALASDSVVERLAAAVALVILQVRPLPPVARQTVIQAIVDEEFESLRADALWDALADLHVARILDEIGPDVRAEIVDPMLTNVESGFAGHDTMQILLDTLFPNPNYTPAHPVDPTTFTEQQARFVRAVSHGIGTGERLYAGAFPYYGLPELARGWRELAAGRPAPVVDTTLPILSFPHDPQSAVRPDQLNPGDRIRHRKYGLGQVIETERDRSFTRFSVLFDDEGLQRFRLPSDGSPL